MDMSSIEAAANISTACVIRREPGTAGKGNAAEGPALFPQAVSGPQENILRTVISVLQTKRCAEVESCHAQIYPWIASWLRHDAFFY